MPLYAFGSNGSGQLGVGHQQDLNRPTLHLTQFPQREHAVPLIIRGGGNHTVIVYSSSHGESGEAFVCGKVLLGLTYDTLLQSFPLNVEANFCAANWETVTTCTESPRSLTVWGKSQKGELPRSAKEAEVPFSSAFPLDGSPWTDDKDLKIIDVASGLYHTVVILSNGEGWAWGANRRGQCHQSTFLDYQRPMPLKRIGFKIKRVVCGREFTYLVGDPKEGSHKILGGAHIGPKAAIHNDAPDSVPGWKDIGANWAGIFVLFEDGQLVSWGKNDHGQMCPPSLPPIKTIAIGSEHVLAIDKLNRVLAWGWGEHGNCGPDTDKDGDVKGRYAVIEVPDGANQIVEGIGAGFATSWIWTQPKKEHGDPQSEIAKWRLANDDGRYPCKADLEPVSFD